jgi:hypothetical protein
MSHQGYCDPFTDGFLADVIKVSLQNTRYVGCVKVMSSFSRDELNLLISKGGS